MFLEQIKSFKNPFWMYLLGTFVVILFCFIGQIPLNILLFEETPLGGDPMETLRKMNKNLKLVLFLIPFAVSLLGLWLVVRKLHNRTMLSITTSRNSVDWKRFFYAFGFWVILALILITIDYCIAPEDYQWNFNATLFFTMFAIAVLLIPLQTSLEEFLFRGYLMQGFGGLFRNRWAPLLLTSVIFGVIHVFNPEVEKLGYGLLAYYIGTGLFLGIMTLMDEGIELALGFHAANNLTIAIFVTSTWSALQTEPLLIDVSTPSIGEEVFIPLFVTYPLSLIIASKKYGWKNWKEKLTAKF